jgi:hypothetical protein
MALSSHVRTESERSDDEKGVRGTVQAVNMPVDPDAHLSAAERASIVCEPIYEPIDLEAHQATGSKTCLEAGLVPDTMGKRITVPRKPPNLITRQLCILYLLAFLDRTNIGNAKVDGLQKSLHNMSTGKYNAALTMFFISYSIFEPLTNVLLKRLKPSIFIPIIM